LSFDKTAKSAVPRWMGIMFV